MPRGFIENLQRRGELSADDQAAFAAAFASVGYAAAAEDIVGEGEHRTQCQVLVDGLAFRHRTLADGRRQIMSFLAPGDMLDLQGLFLPMDHSVCALTRCQLARAPHARLRELMASHPAIDRALWRESLAEAAVFREWMVGMGRRTAYARIAHFFCEVFARLSQAGMAEGRRIHFPITQQHLSDSLGLSTVHTNRTLQALRAARLISFQGGYLTVLDWAGLTAAGEFDPGYLHLDQRAA